MKRASTQKLRTEEGEYEGDVGVKLQRVSVIGRKRKALILTLEKRHIYEKVSLQTKSRGKDQRTQD